MKNLAKFFLPPAESANEGTPPSAGTSGESLGADSFLQQARVQVLQITPEARIVCHSDPYSPGTDRFRFLRMQLREIWRTGKLRRLMITSPLPGDGKSTIALNLATALAERGKRTVLLIDADMHHATLAETLQVQTGPGLAECLAEDLNPAPMLRRLEPLSWYLMPAGKARGNPTELLQSELFSRMMQKLSPHFDWILLDTPPVIPLTDALSVSQHADASLLVVRSDQTPREAISDALSRLGTKSALGIIVNGTGDLDRLYRKYHGYYDQK